MRKLLNFVIFILLLPTVSCGQIVPEIECYSERQVDSILQAKQEIIDSLDFQAVLWQANYNELQKSTQDTIMHLTRMIEELANQVDITGDTTEAILRNDSTYLRVRREGENFWVQLSTNNHQNRLYLHKTDQLEFWKGEGNESKILFRFKLD
jgi:hypothetical protein